MCLSAGYFNYNKKKSVYSGVLHVITEMPLGSSQKEYTDINVWVFFNLLFFSIDPIGILVFCLLTHESAQVIKRQHKN